MCQKTGISCCIYLGNHSVIGWRTHSRAHLISDRRVQANRIILCKFKRLSYPSRARFVAARAGPLEPMRSIWKNAPTVDPADCPVSLLSRHCMTRMAGYQNDLLGFEMMPPAAEDGRPCRISVLGVVVEDVVELLLQHLRLAALLETASRQGLAQGALSATSLGRSLAHVPGEGTAASERTHMTPLIERQGWTCSLPINCTATGKISDHRGSAL